MAPLTPTWAQPSHPDVQEVIINEKEFTSKSLSKVSLPPFGFFAKMSFPPCTEAEEPTYATVQMRRNKHLNLNSDLLYINHSCEPSLIFDTANLNIIAGPRGLMVGEELTFFYPSTEWNMAQAFDCLCGTPTCRGRIGGAGNMTAAQLEGTWLNGHIRELLEERQHKNGTAPVKTAADTASADPTARALRDALSHAEKVVEAARAALESYIESSGAVRALEQASGATRRGPTSRELSGEMGGDTPVI